MRPGWKDKPNGPSVFAIQVMATKGPLLLVEVPPWTATVKDGHAENGRANKPPVTPMSQDFLLSLLRPFFTFISFSSPLLSPSLSLHADEMSLNFVRLAYVGEGERDTRIVRYHIGKFVAGREFEIWLFISMECGFPYSPLHLYFLYSALEADIPDNFFSIFKDIWQFSFHSKLS